ncbi:MAG: ATP synthase subunit I [Aeromonas molluscorum]|jgi:F1F0 ATPase subunit 2
MMSEWAVLSACLVTGFVLGLLFFGGLWWTVRRGIASAQVAFWFLGSLLLRTAVVMMGFWLLGGDDWRRWLATLLGFLLARLLVTQVTRKSELTGTQHEP